MQGRTLSHYTVAEPIGEGGMGVVYRARDLHLERDVALKVLPAGALADDASRRRFRKEALALSTLNHPNIATVFDFDTQDGVDFLVMELVPGSSLRERLKEGALPLEETGRLGRQLLEGLSAAHARGVVHRDLKPENIRVTPEGRLKILDFGLATLIGLADEGAATRTVSELGVVKGTVPYMAPEQLRGQAVDARTDLFAAGSVLYEMVSGGRPFAQRSGPQLIEAILHQPPPSLRSSGGPVPDRLEPVLLRSLEKEPAKRYQSATEFLRDFDRTLSVEPPAARARPTGFPRRAAWLAAAAATVALAVIVIVGWLKVQGAPATAADHTLLILPLEVRGQQDGAEYVGQAVAESLAIGLAKARGLRVLAVPAATAAATATGGPARRAITSGADRLVTGALTRSGAALEIRLTLLDAAENRVVWGTSRRQTETDLPVLADVLAKELTAALGTTLPVVYEDPENLTGAPDIAAAPDALLALAAMKRYELRAAGEAARRLVQRFPDRREALALRAEIAARGSWGNVRGDDATAMDEALR